MLKLLDKNNKELKLGVAARTIYENYPEVFFVLVTPDATYNVLFKKPVFEVEEELKKNKSLDAFENITYITKSFKAFYILDSPSEKELYIRNFIIDLKNKEIIQLNKAELERKSLPSWQKYKILKEDESLKIGKSITNLDEFPLEYYNFVLEFRWKLILPNKKKIYILADNSGFVFENRLFYSPLVKCKNYSNIYGGEPFYQYFPALTNFRDLIRSILQIKIPSNFYSIESFIRFYQKRIRDLKIELAARENGQETQRFTAPTDVLKLDLKESEIALNFLENLKQINFLDETQKSNN